MQRKAEQKNKPFNFNLKALYLSKFYKEKTFKNPLEKVKNIQNIIAEQVNKNKSFSHKKGQKDPHSYKLIVYDPFLTSPQQAFEQKIQQKSKTVYSPQKYGLQNMNKRLVEKKKIDLIRAASCSTSPRQRFIKSSQTHRVRVQVNKNYIKWFRNDCTKNQSQISFKNVSSKEKKQHLGQQKVAQSNNFIECKYEQNKKSPQSYFKKEQFPSKKVIIANSNLGEQEQKYLKEYKRMHKLIEEESKFKILKLSDKRIIHGKTHNLIDLTNRKQVKTERRNRKNINSTNQNQIIKSLRINKKNYQSNLKNQNDFKSSMNQFDWFTNPQIKKVIKSQKREQNQKDYHMTNSIQPWNVKEMEDFNQSKRME